MIFYNYPIDQYEMEFVMNINQNVLGVFLISFMLVACAEKDTKEMGENEAMADPDKALALISQAKVSFDEINAVGGAWSETEDMIKEAEKLVKEKKINKAEKLAADALLQNRLATMQHESQKNAGPLY